MADVRRCEKCRYAVTYIGAYTGTHFIECSLEAKMVETATLEQLDEMIKHPERRPCTYKKGTPKDGGVTFDD